MAKDSKLFLYVCFILPPLFWGGSFLGIRYSVEGFTVPVAVFLRVFVGFVAFLPLFFFKRGLNIKHRYAWPAFISGAFAFSIPWLMLFWGEKHVQPALASIINATVPLHVAIMSPFFLKGEKLTVPKIIGVVLGLVGVSIIFLPEVNWDHLTNHALGLISVEGCMIVYTVSIISSRWLGKYIESDLNLFYQFLGGLAFILPFVIFNGAPFVLPAFTYKSVLAEIYLGVFSTAIGQFLFLNLLRMIDSAKAATTTYILPLVAIVLDLVILKKMIQPHQALGASLIMVALFIVNNKIRFSKKEKALSTEYQSA